MFSHTFVRNVVSPHVASTKTSLVPKTSPALTSSALLTHTRKSVLSSSSKYATTLSAPAGSSFEGICRHGVSLAAARASVGLAAASSRTRIAVCDNKSSSPTTSASYNSNVRYESDLRSTRVNVNRSFHTGSSVRRTVFVRRTSLVREEEARKNRRRQSAARASPSSVSSSPSTPSRRSCSSARTIPASLSLLSFTR